MLILGQKFAKAANPEACLFPCFRCNIKPCAKEAPSAVGLHSMPHLCRVAVDGHPCGIDPVPTPDGDSGDDDDDVDGDDTLGGKQSDEWFKDSIDKLDGMKSKDSFDGSETLRRSFHLTRVRFNGASE